MHQFLVILRGTPASGKSTIAKSFRDFSEKIVWLKVDNFKDFFADNSSLALEYVNGSAVATLDYLLDQGFSVVMDGVFQDTKAIDKALAMAREKHIFASVYQTSCSLSVLQKRDLERPGVPEGIRKPLGKSLIAGIHQKLVDNPYPGIQVLDTENQTLDQCIEVIRNDIMQKKF
ncbi:MAG: zeta toxin family protein [Candidatus Levybacteria bacterium]|nr:zeta toxin family protein [Candidatus Levybacteria bacterium]